MNTEKPLWTPNADAVQSSDLQKFMNLCGRGGDDYDAFWQWSVDEPAEFWSKFWDFAGIIGDKGDTVITHPDKMIGGQFFPNGHVNYAENMLRHRNDNTAIIFRNEKGVERKLSFNDLYDQVSQWQQLLMHAGVKKGDRVAACMPNCPETIIACLATTSIGAVWSSASPDFGAQGLIDRFAQIEPTVLISVDAYYNFGKTIDCLDKIATLQKSIPNLSQTIIVPFCNDAPAIENLTNAVLSPDALNQFTSTNIEFETVPFNHPLVIMFSSGTTGVPKCIVHGHGGTLIQHLKEHKLQCDIKANDRIFYYTTCGWMMWNWLITGLANGATLLLYDGNAFYPNRNVLWDFTSKHGAMLFGTAAKYIDAMRNAKMRPKDTHDLSALKLMTSTGSPLVHESFDYVYNSIKDDLHLASISGGTDIVSCFMLGNPISPVWRGEIQGAGLGLSLDVFDDDGQSLESAIAGELVCTKPFPCMPVGFWNDPDNVKFHASYFDTHDNVWAHGDWVEKTPHGGFIIHGRSDATLNPGGVRIGTAEIYRQVEKISVVQESIAVGQEWKGDIRIVLFVILNDGAVLDDDLKSDIKKTVRNGASPRHVPAVIIQVTDIPRTKSGKITELAVKHIIHGREVKNKEALANPEALDLYRDMPELQPT
jgi:acetoacetyl-CoA synthetase